MSSCVNVPSPDHFDTSTSERMMDGHQSAEDRMIRRANEATRLEQPRDGGAARGERKRDVASTRREIERARARRRRREVDETCLPPPIESERERDRSEVVAIGNRREERAHVATLAFGRGDAFGYSH